MLKTITNNVPRPIIDASELTVDERVEFDYLDWASIELGTNSASFFRYKGELYDLGEFFLGDRDLPSIWDAYQPSSYFSTTAVRFVDTDYIVVGVLLF